MGRVAERIDAWLRYEHTKWDVDLEPFVAWASTAGDDVAAAWDACPRADHLVGLAGALGVPFVFLIKPLCAVARDALRLVPPREHAARQLVTQWERWRPPTSPRQPAPESDAHRAVWKRVDDWHVEVEREGLLFAAVADPLEAAIKRVITERFDAFEARVRRGLVDAGDDPIGRQIDDVVASLRSFFATDRAALMWRSALPGSRRSLASGHAIRAVGSLSVAVGSGDQMMSTMELARALGPRLGGAERDKIMRLAERGNQRVFTEGALVFHHAARAAGLDRAVAADSLEAVFALGLATFEAQLRDSAAGTAERATPMATIIGECLDALAETCEADTSLALANTLRAAVPRAEVLRAAERETAFWCETGPSLAEGLGLMRPPRTT